MHDKSIYIYLTNGVKKYCLFGKYTWFLLENKYK